MDDRVTRLTRKPQTLTPPAAKQMPVQLRSVTVDEYAASPQQIPFHVATNSLQYAGTSVDRPDRDRDLWQFQSRF